MQTTDLTRAELLEARSILERAHNYIEECGFDIALYEREPYGPRCYIGAMRGAAGLACSPKFFDPSAGRPTLAFAFRALDRAVAEQAHQRGLSQKDIDRGYLCTVGGPEAADYSAPGRLAEAAGMALGSELLLALSAFREALTEIHNQLQELDRLDAEAAQLQPEREKVLA